jgi:hypothetical protein
VIKGPGLGHLITRAFVIVRGEGSSLQGEQGPGGVITSKPSSILALRCSGYYILVVEE